jgi:hypothetical protein
MLSMIISMIGVTLFLFANGVFGVALSSMPNPSAITESLKKDFVSNWSVVLAGMFWISLATASVIQCLRYLNKLSKSQVSECTEFRELETLDKDEVSGLSVWMNGSDRSFEHLKGIWS